MKQTLQARLGQQITMTPQLQQAIRLLQLSSLDLQLEVQQNLDSNMMLEVDESEEAETPEAADKEQAETSADDSALDLDKKADLPEELPVDSDWEDTFDTGISHLDYPTHSAQAPSDDNRDFLDVNSETETLQDHLRWQLELTPFSDVDRCIALMIIDGIDEDGYLKVALADIVESLNQDEEFHSEESISEQDVQTVLHRVQHFDPLGVGARDLAECLLLQLRVLPGDTEHLVETRHIIENFIGLLGSRDYTQLLRKTKLSREKLQACLELIQAQNPRPGGIISASKAAYVVPDVFIKKNKKGQWIVHLNEESLPRLRVNNFYAGLVNQVKSKQENEQMKSHLQEARWFIKSLRSRHDTLLKVTRCIVEQQSAFLDYGEEAMKPLVLHDIASELDMHESTISRVTTQKYVHTPRGVFELKYFFSSHVSTSNGGECSSTAIRAFIKKLISSEESRKPLSDNKIAELLKEQGINVARRTVAKYREAMTIPPSNERKQLL